jgi:hypothetical protein
MRNNKALKKLLEPIIIITTQGRRSISLHTHSTHTLFYFVFFCFSLSVDCDVSGRLMAVPLR